MMKRAQSSEMNNDMPASPYFLSSTISATSYHGGASDKWSSGDANSPIFAHTLHSPLSARSGGGMKTPIGLGPGEIPSLTVGFVDISTEGEGQSPSRRSMEGDIGSNNNNLKVKVPNDKYCGLSLSRSEENVARKPIRSLKVSNLVIETPLSGELSENSNTLTPEVIQSLLNEPEKAVEILLDALDLSALTEVFTEHNMNLPSLLSLNDADLRSIGVKTFSSRRKIIQSIRLINEHTNYKFVAAKDRPTPTPTLQTQLQTPTGGPGPISPAVPYPQSALLPVPPGLGQRFMSTQTPLEQRTMAFGSHASVQQGHLLNRKGSPGPGSQQQYQHQQTPTTLSQQNSSHNSYHHPHSHHNHLSNNPPASAYPHHQPYLHNHLHSHFGFGSNTVTPLSLITGQELSATSNLMKGPASAPIREPPSSSVHQHQPPLTATAPNQTRARP
jgi:hypothetical protein